MTAEQPEDTKDITPVVQKIKRKVVIVPMVSRVDASKIGNAPEPQRTFVYAPGDHRLDTHEQANAGCGTSMLTYVRVEPEPKPLMHFH